MESTPFCVEVPTYCVEVTLTCVNSTQPGLGLNWMPLCLRLHWSKPLMSWLIISNMQQDSFLLQSASIVLSDLYVEFPMLDFNLYCRSSVITFFHSNSLKCTVLSYWFDYSALGQCKLNHNMSIPYLILLVECTSGYLHSAPKCLANKQGVKQGPVWRLERERGISFARYCHVTVDARSLNNWLLHEK